MQARFTRREVSASLLAAVVACASTAAGCAGPVGVPPPGVGPSVPGAPQDSMLTIESTYGAIEGTLVITLRSSAEGAAIRYVVGGDEMSSPGESVPYQGPFVLWPQALTENSTNSVWAYATVDGEARPPTWAFFQMGLPPDPRPVFSPPPGTYAAPQDVTITTSVPAATIRYTLDGSEPNGASPRYTGPIHVEASTTIRADAFLNYDSTPPVEARYSF